MILNTQTDVYEDSFSLPPHFRAKELQHIIIRKTYLSTDKAITLRNIKSTTVSYRVKGKGKGKGKGHPRTGHEDPEGE